MATAYAKSHRLRFAGSAAVIWWLLAMASSKETNKTEKRAMVAKPVLEFQRLTTCLPESSSIHVPIENNLGDLFLDQVISDNSSFSVTKVVYARPQYTVAAQKITAEINECCASMNFFGMKTKTEARTEGLVIECLGQQIRDKLLKGESHITEPECNYNWCEDNNCNSVQSCLRSDTNLIVSNSFATSTYGEIKPEKGYLQVSASTAVYWDKFTIEKEQVVLQGRSLKLAGGHVFLHPDGISLTRFECILRKKSIVVSNPVYTLTVARTSFVGSRAVNLTCGDQGLTYTIADRRSVREALESIGHALRTSGKRRRRRSATATDQLINSIMTTLQYNYVGLKDIQQKATVLSSIVADLVGKTYRRAENSLYMVLGAIKIWDITESELRFSQCYNSSIIGLMAKKGEGSQICACTASALIMLNNESILSHFVQDTEGRIILREHTACDCGKKPQILQINDTIIEIGDSHIQLLNQTSWSELRSSILFIYSPDDNALIPLAEAVDSLRNLSSSFLMREAINAIGLDLLALGASVLRTWESLSSLSADPEGLAGSLADKVSSALSIPSWALNTIAPFLLGTLCIVVTYKLVKCCIVQAGPK